MRTDYDSFKCRDRATLSVPPRAYVLLPVTHFCVSPRFILWSHSWSLLSPLCTVSRREPKKLRSDRKVTLLPAAYSRFVMENSSGKSSVKRLSDLQIKTGFVVDNLWAGDHRLILERVVFRRLQAITSSKDRCLVSQRTIIFETV